MAIKITLSVQIEEEAPVVYTYEERLDAFVDKDGDTISTYSCPAMDGEVCWVREIHGRHHYARLTDCFDNDGEPVVDNRPSKKQYCLRCNGAGYVRDPSPMGESWDKETCSECHGSGERCRG